MTSLLSALLETDFLPLPLLGNPHVQTILGSLLPGRCCPPPQRRHVVAMPDGDAVALHENVPPGWHPGQPIALLVHGLTGSHLSTNVRRLAARLLGRRVRVFRLDQRGAGPDLSLARRTYHAGRSDDVRRVLDWLHRQWSHSPLLLIGVSLGGNVVLKLAGELGSHSVPGLVRVAAIAPPIDLQRCSDLICLPRNRFYDQHFAQGLLRAARRRQRHFPDLPPLRLPRRPTLFEFDDLYTGPHNGFAGAHEYYRLASSFPLIAHIPIPTLILTARDDPFIAVEPFERLRPPPNVHVHILAKGGHVGFLGRDREGGIRWGEQRIVDWITHS